MVMNKTQEQRKQQRIVRYFSEDFKRKKVQEIDNNLTSVTQVSSTYQVSRAAVYKWVYKYSLLYKKGLKQVVEAKSDTRKIQQLQEKIKHLEQSIGQKQLKIEFLEKMVDLTEEQYKIDIKKKATSLPWSGSGGTKKDKSSK
jgi:transposase-like protein